MTAQNHEDWTAFRHDALLIVFLIGLDVAARLLLHVPNVSPVAASALFAGMMLQRKGFSLLVPAATMMIGDAISGFYDWRVMAVVYAALTLPAVAGMLAREHRVFRVVAPVVLACSLVFFAATNFAVWAFSDMYSLDMTGLIACYAAGLPFLKTTVAGDLLWAAVLFGGAALVQRLTARRTALAS